MGIKRTGEIRATQIRARAGVANMSDWRGKNEIVREIGWK